MPSSTLNDTETSYISVEDENQYFHLIGNGSMNSAMPDAMSPILNRELVYTAVTRAKQSFSLLTADPSVLQQAIGRRIAPASRLFL